MDEKHPRQIWHLNSVTGTNTVAGATDHNYKAYRDRMEVRWRPTSFRNYFTGMVVTWVAAGTNTSAVTLNINSRGAKALTKNGPSTALSAGDLVSGTVYEAIYNGTGFELFGGFGSGSGTGTDTIGRATVSGDGAIQSSKNVSTVSRTGIGVYLVTSTLTFALNASSKPDYSPVATPASTSGSGADGLVPFKAFSAATSVATGTYATNHAVFFYVPSRRKLYFPDAGTDNIYIHNIDDWTAAAVTIDPGADPISSGENAGCLSREKDYLWLSAEETPFCPLRAVNIATSAVTTFTTTLTHTAAGAFTDSGNIGVLIADGATLKLYHPNFGTGALGSVIRSWGFTAAGQFATQGEWDSENRIWFSGPNNAFTFYQVNPLITSTFRTHSYPTALVGTSPNPGCRPTFDSLRNRFYVQVGGSTGNHILTYQGWSNSTNDSGTWAIFARNMYPTAIGYEPASDVVLIWEYAVSLLHRFLGSTGQKIDTYHIPTDIPGYTIEPDDFIFYIEQCAYLRGILTAGSVRSMIRICYKGAELNVGSGATVSNVLIAHTTVVNQTQFNVELFKSVSPIIRGDGFFNTIFSGTVA